MPVAMVGELALWMALLLAVWGAVVSMLGRAFLRPELVSSAARALHAVAFMLALALLALATSLARLDVSLVYVAAYGGANATLSETVGAVWSGSAGALLVLGIAAAMAASLATARMTGLTAPRDVATAVAIVHLALLGVVVTLILGARPFESLTWLPADGRGLPPLQRHPAALLLPPIWAMATAAALAAFAAAIAAAMVPTGRQAVSSLAGHWARWGWVLVTGAVVTALWWSYETAGTPGIWSARVVGPVPLAAWFALTGAAFPGDSPPATMRAGRLRLALMGLPLLLLLTSVLVRAEGTWDPLHELSHGSGVVWWIVTIAALAQLFGYSILRTPGMTPAISVPRTGVRSLATRLARVGALLLLIGLAAGGFRRDHLVELRPGASTEVSGLRGTLWRVTFQGASIREVRGSAGLPRWREMLVPVAMTAAGEESRLVVAEVREYLDALGRVTSPPWPYPAIRRGLLQDIIVIPEEFVGGEAARMRVSFVPLAGLIWLGGITLVVGGGLMAGRGRP